MRAPSESAITAKYRPLSELAIYASTSEKTLRRLALKGDLTTYLVAGRRLSTTDEIDKLMARNRNRKPKSSGRGQYDRTNAEGDE